MPPESGIFGHQDGPLQVRRDPRVWDPLLYTPGRAAFGARLARAKVDESGRARIVRAKRPHVGNGEIEKDEVAEAEGRDRTHDAAETSHSAIIRRPYNC